jgi:hypothetical protein
MKNYFTLIILFVSYIGFAQKNNPNKKTNESIEIMVADTACLCFNKIDTTQMNANYIHLKRECLNQAIIKNKENIQKTYKDDRRMDSEKMSKQGLQGELLIRVQNILTEKCESYQTFEKNVQQSRGGGNQNRRR